MASRVCRGQGKGVMIPRHAPRDMTPGCDRVVRSIDAATRTGENTKEPYSAP